MTTVNTVALLAPTGLVGSELLKTFADLDKAGKIKLIVLHRPSSNVSSVPSGVEKRVLDVETATASDVRTALKGVDILVSATNKVSPEADARFLDSLAALPAGQLKVYIPSDYSTTWSAEEEADPSNALIYGKAVLHAKARALGLPLAIVRNGLLEPFVFIPSFVGIDAKANTLSLYGDALAQSIPATSVPYLAAGVGQLVTHPPATLAGQTFYIIENAYTGQQIADALAAANGKAPTVTAVTDAEVDAIAASGLLGGLIAAVRRKWAKGGFTTKSNADPEGVERRTVDQWVATALKA